MDKLTDAAIEAAKDYLRGNGPWKDSEIGITEDDYLVQCFAKAIQAAEQRGMERAATYHDEIAKRHRTFALGLHRNTSAEAEHRLRQNWHEASAQAIRQGEQA